MIKKAEFLRSVVRPEDFPQEGFPEFAFIGRSNVGKSSLINLLTSRRSLVKTSARPGKTQAINYFLINDRWYMTDLPGYGWSRASKEKKLEWHKLLRDYLLHRKELFNLFILIDSRLEPQEIDIEFINWAGNNRIPLSLVFTKSDKVSVNRIRRNRELLYRDLSDTWSSAPRVFITSAREGRGKEEILDFIASINENII